MKQLLLIVTLFFSANVVFAQSDPIIIFPNGAPHESGTYTEASDRSGSNVSGHSVNRMSEISVPTITIYKAQNPGRDNKTVVVCPGGGYSILAYDLEGSEVCTMLNANGINAVLLKYRVPRRPGRQKHEAALEDLQRAISIVRSRAWEFCLNPNQIGVIGFSAGAHLCAMVSNSDSRIYNKIDDCDTVSTRPDFCALVYPAYLSGENFALASDVKPSTSTPPTFIVQTQDDQNYINSSIFYYYALKGLNVPVTMHLFSEGGHGYGLRDTGKAVNSWPERLVEWIRAL